MQGRARGRKGERKTYHINPYHHITMEFGGYLMIFIECGKMTHARKSAQGRSAWVLSYQKVDGIFDNPQLLLERGCSYCFHQNSMSNVFVLFLSCTSKKLQCDLPPRKPPTSTNQKTYRTKISISFSSKFQYDSSQNEIPFNQQI